MTDRTKTVIKAITLAILIVPYRIMIKRDEDGKFDRINIKALSWQV